MSIFKIGYKNLTHLKFKGESDRYNESSYESPTTINGIIYGDKRYNRDNSEEGTVSGYVCQTLDNVSVKDKINGYIVTKVNEHYDIFGKFDYWEVSLENG